MTPEELARLDQHLKEWKHITPHEAEKLLAEVRLLRGTLEIARTELARWGWGDFHYGSTGQDPRVVEALQKIDEALA